MKKYFALLACSFLSLQMVLKAHKSIFLFLIPCFLSILQVSPAQQLCPTCFVKELPIRGEPVKMIKTKDGGVTILCQTDFVNFSYNQMALLHYDSSYAFSWLKKITLGDSISQFPMDFIETNTGYFLVGAAGSFAFIIATNNLGNILWQVQKQYDTTLYYENNFYKVLELSTNDILVMGGGETNRTNWFFHKFSNTGIFLNSLRIDTSTSSFAYIHILKYSENQLFVCRYFGFASEMQVYTTDENFISNNEKKYTYYSGVPNNFAEPRLLAHGINGDFTFLSHGMFIINSSLDSIFSVPYSEYSIGGLDSWYQQASDMIATSDGGYAIAGKIDLSFEGFGIWIYLIKTDEKGKPVWKKEFRQTVFDGVASVLQTEEDGYLLLVRGLPDSTNVPLMWIIKTDAAGDLFTSIENSTMETNSLLNFFPNPVNNKLCIHSYKNISGKISLYNLLGEIVFNRNINFANESFIDFSGFPNGVYYLKFENKDINTMYKIVKISN